jgi:hypothetical protein
MHEANNLQVRVATTSDEDQMFRLASFQINLLEFLTGVGSKLIVVGWRTTENAAHEEAGRLRW